MVNESLDLNSVCLYGHSLIVWTYVGLHRDHYCWLYSFFGGCHTS